MKPDDEGKNPQGDQDLPAADTTIEPVLSSGDIPSARAEYNEPAVPREQHAAHDAEDSDHHGSDGESDEGDEGTDEPREPDADAPPAREQSHRGRDRSERRGGRSHQNRRAAAAEQDDGDEEESFTHEGAEVEYETDDPLAPAYDLERGTPLSHNKHGEHDFKAATKVRSAKEFFNSEILYRYDILDDEDRNSLRGRYRIELKGYQGGVWTVFVEDQMEVVNRREDAEIVFTLQQSDFLHLVNGQLNPQLALFAQKMRVQGDIRKAVHFQNVLVPGAEA